MNGLQKEIENRHLPLYDEGNISFFLRSGTHFLGRDDWHAVMKYREEKTI